VRYATTDDFPAIAELDGASFGMHYTEADLADALLDVDPSRFLIEEDAGRVVAATADLPFTMTLPGGQVRAAGITWVSVELTHRRQGILRRLVERQLRDRAADGFAAAILSAAEGGIYGRYGFGVADYAVETVVERRDARLREPVDHSGVRRLPTEAARDLLPAIHERWRRDVPGAVDRTPERWQLMLLDRQAQRGAASGLFHLVHPDGFVSYRITQDWNSGLPQHRCTVMDYVPVTPEAHAALWQVLLANDLVGRIESRWIPEDDPLPLLLENQRHVRQVSRADGQWVRPLDIAALLSNRTYAVEVDVVLEVIDPLLGDGRYHLTGGPDGGSCERTAADPVATLPVATLGAVVVGGVRLARLARAGLAAVDAAVLSRLDRALLADRAAHHGTYF
jgi:predicted acetyltransferase